METLLDSNDPDVKEIIKYMQKHPEFNDPDLLVKLSKKAQKDPYLAKMLARYTIEVIRYLMSTKEEIPSTTLVHHALTVDAMYCKMSPARQDDDLYSPTRITQTLLTDMDMLMYGGSASILNINYDRIRHVIFHNDCLKALFTNEYVSRHLLLVGQYLTNILADYGNIREVSIHTTVNLCIWGIRQKDLNEFIEAIKDIIVKTCKNVVFSRNLISVLFDVRFGRSSITYVIYLKIYESRGHILHASDLACKCVGFDTNNIYFTSLGLFSYTHNVNIYEPAKITQLYGISLANNHNSHNRGLIFPGYQSNEHPNLEFPDDVNYTVARSHVDIHMGSFRRLWDHDESTVEKQRATRMLQLTKGFKHGIIKQSKTYDGLFKSDVTDVKAFYLDLHERLFIHSMNRYDSGKNDKPVKTKKNEIHFSIEELKAYFEDCTLSIVTMLYNGDNDIEKYLEVVSPLIEKYTAIATTIDNQMLTLELSAELQASPLIYGPPMYSAKTYGCDYKPFEIGIPWASQRLLWIAIKKPDVNCRMSILPRDVIIVIINACIRLIEAEYLEYLQEFVSYDPSVREHDCTCEGDHTMPYNRQYELGMQILNQDWYEQAMVPARAREVMGIPRLQRGNVGWQEPTERNEYNDIMHPITTERDSDDTFEENPDTQVGENTTWKFRDAITDAWLDESDE